MTTENDVVNVPMDAYCRLEVAAMIYARWSAAFDQVKKVDALSWESTNKFCPKADWPSYHYSMKETAKKELELARLLKDQVCKYSPLAWATNVPQQLRQP